MKEINRIIIENLKEAILYIEHGEYVPASRVIKKALDRLNVHVNARLTRMVRGMT